MELAGRIAVVTGASSGIGWATAWALAREGATVVAAARRIDRLERLARAIEAHGGTASAVACDVGNRASVEAMAERVAELHGRCDVLVNNAGIPGGGRFAEVPLERLEEVTRVNYLGVVTATRLFLPGMLERGIGHVVNVASLAGRFAVPGAAIYSASKHAVVALSEALFHELAGTGVVVTAVNPGLVRTERFPHPGRSPWLMIPTSRIADVVVEVVRGERGPEVAVPRWIAPFEAIRPLAPPVYRALVRAAVRRAGGATPISA